MSLRVPPPPAATHRDWQDRFLSPRWSLPSWGRLAPDRFVLSGDPGGTWEIFAWSPGSAPRRVTERPNGTSIAAITPDGGELWWFADTDGDEFGVWRRQPWSGGVGADVEAVRGVPPAYPAGLAFGPGGRVVVGGSDDSGTVLRAWDGTNLTTIYAHAEDAGVAAISRDGTRVAISHSEHGDSRHPALRVLDWHGAIIADLADGPNKGLHGYGFLDESHDLLVGHERHGRDELLVWSVDSGAVRELAIPVEGELSATRSPDGSYLVVAADARGRTTLHRYDLRTGDLTALEVPPGTVDGVAVRPDGAIWYDCSSAASPPMVRDIAGAAVLPPPGEPTAPPSVPVHDVTAPGPGGPVPGFLRVPPGRQAPYATVFSIHGGPTWHDSDAWSVRAAAWVDAGYAVVTVNYRGSTGYGAAWRDAIEAAPGLVELEDIAAVRTQLVADGVADPARCVLEGGSWGGFLTLLGLGTQPELWACGSAAVPVADYLAAYDDEMDGLKAFDRSLFGGSPAEVRDKYVRASPLSYVDNVRAPVQVLAGENDPRCPIQQIENYLAELDRLGKPHEVYRFEAGHGSYVAGERIAQTQAQLDFVAAHVHP